ncbi:hypothetical protein GF406_27195 [candidate division KSB1 bacterium]|nr:hypothetical protein [candidate division KSB1 bacterium]
MDHTSHLHCFSGRRIAAIIGMVLVGILLAAALGLLLGFIVMWLWNWLMPTIFGLPVISFWQAWGLVVLTHIFFKSFPHHSKHHHDNHWKEHFRRKFHEHQEQRIETSPENSQENEE